MRFNNIRIFQWLKFILNNYKYINFKNNWRGVHDENHFPDLGVYKKLYLYWIYETIKVEYFIILY